MSKLFSGKVLWPIGFALVRIMAGWFILRYSRELFHIDGLLDFLKDSRFPFPVFSGYAAKIIELVGGICLMLGLFTRWVTPLLIITMIGVIYVTAKGNIYAGEVAFLYLLLFAVFLFQGPGKWSLDSLLEKRLNRRQENRKVDN